MPCVVYMGGYVSASAVKCHLCQSATAVYSIFDIATVQYPLPTESVVTVCHGYWHMAGFVSAGCIQIAIRYILGACTNFIATANILLYFRR